MLAFADVTKEDLLFLVRGAAKLRTGQSGQQILLAIAAGRGHLLRIVGQARGVITGEIVIHPAGREFRMGIFAGSGIFPTQYAAVADSLFDWAKAKGCRWVEFENLHPALDRNYGRKFTREGTVFVKEL